MERAKEGEILKEWFYGAAWTKVRCLFSATTQWSQQSIWGIFHTTRMMYSIRGHTRQQGWCTSRFGHLARCLCWTGFFQCADSLARMLWKEPTANPPLSIEMNLLYVAHLHAKAMTDIHQVEYWVSEGKCWCGITDDVLFTSSFIIKKPHISTSALSL